ncbi:amidohydrolase family protein [Salinicoccus halodurans]|uniref:5-methylthioadenosine/S-adenosylhomocysteine deaminase n=1 Tax=Salinicoccus halodurans TaxID=407035 RepID=A0A0F7HLB5_9STAP|nr:amidohydrolase family protein [Salinicoccus halodurans]AKG73898.1 hypothetical protein AAT16_06430 [Salinicoccus halodurans]SFK57445.1 5-methylthioadenosine/S-adenosylhomocysteine deaminase [Salinicoccus halodurans]
MLLKNATYLNSDMKFETQDFVIEEGEISFNSEQETEEDVIDCGDYYIIPGLANAHFHSYSPLAKGLMKEMALQNWSDDSDQGKIQQALFDYVDNKLTEEEFTYIAQKSYIDMVKNGVTFVSDSDPRSPEYLKDALDEIGLRGIIDAYEEIGDYYKTEGKVIYGSHLLEEEDITDEELLNVKEIKDKYNPIMMTHCLENKWRSDIVQSKYGQSSVDLYKGRGLLNKNTVLFHGVYMSNEDIDILAELNGSVVHCPISNLDTGAGVAPISSMIEKGVNVCLGTDYSHTNIWDVMRMTYYLLKINNPVQRYSAEDIFKMATINGARAYNLQETMGKIKEGYKADLVFIRKEPELEPLVSRSTFTNSLHNLLIHSKEDSVEHVMIEGGWIMKDREIMTIDEEKVKSRYRQIAEKFVEYLNR